MNFIKRFLVTISSFMIPLLTVAQEGHIDEISRESIRIDRAYALLTFINVTGVVLLVFVLATGVASLLTKQRAGSGASQNASRKLSRIFFISFTALIILYILARVLIKVLTGVPLDYV